LLVLLHWRDSELVFYEPLVPRAGSTAVNAISAASSGPQNMAQTAPHDGFAY
jgi:hypothetical protein